MPRDKDWREMSLECLACDRCYTSLLKLFDINLVFKNGYGYGCELGVLPRNSLEHELVE